MLHVHGLAGLAAVEGCATAQKAHGHMVPWKTVSHILGKGYSLHPIFIFFFYIHILEKGRRDLYYNPAKKIK